ncbi:MAG: hypothetical protein JNM63_00245, partial [Spirochaetia bacterium]|nr:hypothetical protein [Spirochaetia bacterium]
MKIMKKILLALFSIAGGTMALEASVLIETGKPHAVIVIPAGAAEQLRTDWNKSTYAAYGYAAARLKEYFKEVAGADIPVTNEGVNFSGTPIYLGPCRAVLEAIKKDPALDQKEPEGYSIFPVKNGTAIYGEISNGFDRGILFGVYRFAEKVLGMKWYFPEPDGLGRVIPQKKTLVLDSWREKSAPYFKLRYGLISQAISNREKTGPYLLEGSSLGFWAN